MKPRVFISYCRKDRDVAHRIRGLLKEYGFEVLWDESMREGSEFSRQIQTYIAHAHVFLPLLTEEASNRAWVHQEIGFAKAYNIEIFPVCIGHLPEGFISGLHAAEVTPDLQNLEDKVSKNTLLSLADEYSAANAPLYECAEDAEKRAQMLADYAQTVSKMRHYGVVCHRSGGLSSFAIPDRPLDDPVWDERDHKTQYDRQVRRRERTALEEHAKNAGCKLIIRTKLDYGGARSKKVRLDTLVDFLKTNSHHATYAVVDESLSDLPQSAFPSIICVGNWFLASSRAASVEGGYKQTIFTRHAPTIEKTLEDFEATFGRILSRSGTSLINCREHTIDCLERLSRDEEEKLSKR
jgi:TIR domain-containing protein